MLLICKMVFCAIVFAICTYIGVLKSNKFGNRVTELKNFKHGLEIFKTKIRYTHQPVNEVFLEISNQISGIVGETFKKATEYGDINIGWVESLLDASLNLTEEDLEILTSIR